MHEASGVEFLHGCVDDGEASPAVLPSLQLLGVVLPLHLVELGLEGVVLPGEDLGEVVRDVDVEVAPVQLVDEVVFEAEFGEDCVVDLSDGDWREVEIGGEGSRWDDRVVPQLVVVLELPDLRQDLQGVAPPATHSDLLVLLVKTVDLLSAQTALQLLQGRTLLKVRLLELESVGLADCQVAQTVVLEGREDQISLLCLL